MANFSHYIYTNFGYSSFQDYSQRAFLFGVFESPSPTQSSSFGSTFGQTQLAFGNRPFGATNQHAFSVTSKPALMQQVKLPLVLLYSTVWGFKYSRCWSFKYTFVWFCKTLLLLVNQLHHLVQHLRQHLRSCNTFILNSIPVVVIVLGGELTPTKAFSSLSLFSMLTKHKGKGHYIDEVLRSLHSLSDFS